MQLRWKILVSIIIIALLYFFFSGTDKGSDNNEVLPSISKSEFSIEFTNLDSVSESDPEKEYIALKVDPKQLNFLNLSDLELKNSLGEKVKIGSAVQTFYQIELNDEKPIVINEETDLIISSGKSPVGNSFRENTCTGFLDQFQNFTPELTGECPSPKSILQDQGYSLSNSCINHLETILNCSIVTELPEYLDENCKEAVRSHLNYNSCVLTQKDKPGFYKNSWRVFLERNDELWKDRNETISILNSLGNVISKKILIDF